MYVFIIGLHAHMDFSVVRDFERAIAKYYGAPYAVATDCCTHAIELCLRLQQPARVTCPAHTYISVPFTFVKLGMGWRFTDSPWHYYYSIGSTNIIDAAVYFRHNGYISGTLMCLSFQFRKPLSLGRGGAILCDTIGDYDKLKRISYDGRCDNMAWADQAIDTIGYHYYMTPETAQQGLEKLPQAHLRATKEWSWQDYPDLRKMPVFGVT